MQILVINTGSSSVKFKLFDMLTETAVVQGQIERIGGDSTISFCKAGEPAQKRVLPLPDYNAAFRHLFSLLGDTRQICAIGHRVAHGGMLYTKPTRITPHVLEQIEANSQFAPLHNKANTLGIRACTEMLGADMPQVAVFDTGFHSEIPRHAYLYPVPYEFYEKYGIRRFGFHGLSHRYTSERCAQLMGRTELKVITCHLGNGCSLAAVKNGVSVDTSMGLTPNEGCMMGTRSGSIDPAILSYVAMQENRSFDEVLDICNKKSGLLGISGVSNDYRDLLESGDARAVLALQMQQYQITKLIGSYIAAMDGVDAIVFTGGIGTNAAGLRREVCSCLNYLGLIFDDGANESSLQEKCISTPDSKVAVYVIPTDEELVIARDTNKLINSEA